MTPARLQTTEEIFHAALDQEPDQISAFLDRACGGDEFLRRNVEALLASHQQAVSFIETPAASFATRIIQNGQADLLVGHTIGHYKLSERIGAGGMGDVYLATDIIAGRKAALKLLPAHFTGDAERLKRFQQEAYAVVGLNHPNILTVYEIGEDRSIHYIASELIQGETLRQRLTRGRMQLSEAVDVATQVASALAAAHHAGIVHRDIKPENVMLRPDGYVKVLDFGIAKLAESAFAEATADGAGSMTLAETNLGAVLGTVRYMSPEQACGAQIDKRTDIWSLGVVLYEMLAGRTPFEGETATDVLAAISDSDPQPLKQRAPIVPRALQTVADRSLRKDPAERYQTAEEMLSDLRAIKEKTDRIAARSARGIAVAAVATLLGSLVLFYAWRGERADPARAPAAIEKSIAVLPFENLSNDEENAFFAGGVHDEILTNLAKVAHLKVISRTSVMKYKSGLERNLREIAKALGVSYVVEGSVQRAGGRVRVSVQLIDARSDAHLWAERYDRDVADLFAIQSEIAQHIVNQLHAKLSAAEKAAITERPTADLVAYAFYTKAKEIDIWHDWEGADKSANKKVELLEKAIQRDPNFALAYCELAKTHVDLGDDRKHLELAKNAAETAVRLRPDLGEAHRELARYYYHARDLDRARDDLTIAQRTLPNDSETFRIAGQIDRLQNRWDASLANLEKASELDPRNIEVAYHLAWNYFKMRRYSELEQFLANDAAKWPVPDPWTPLLLAQMKLAQGDPVVAQTLLEQVPLDFSPTGQIWDVRFTAALYLRDYDAANRVIAAAPARWAHEVFGGRPPESWADGQIARARGDKQKALAVFAAARKNVDTTWGDKPKDSPYLALVACLDAGLGRKEEAIREARRAVDLMPIAKDSLNGPAWVANLALVYAWTGERDRTLEQLEIVATIPGEAPTYGDLRFNPCWDDLRGDPRFDKIVAAAKAASK